MPASRPPSASLLVRARRLVGERGAIGPVLEAICVRAAAVVGDSGVAGILGRATAAHPDLGSLPPGAAWRDRIDAIGGGLEGVDPEVAADRSATLLATFVTMLANLAGDPLIERLAPELFSMDPS
jgi:hypothetical protein